MSIFNGLGQAAIYVISGNGYYSRWSTTCSSWGLIQIYCWLFFIFFVFFLFFLVAIPNIRIMVAIFVISDNGCHAKWLTHDN